MNQLRIRQSLPLILVLTLTLIGAGRIVSTYPHVSQVFDEPFHMLRGLHWQTGHAYVHSEHPPLGPLVFAFLPRLMGVHYSDSGNKLTDGNSILYGNGDYLYTLVLFRIGNLLFFCFACLLIYQLLAIRGRRFEGTIAVAFFTLCPTVLGHSGVATTDMPMTTMLLCTVYFVERAMEKPACVNWGGAGVVTGLAIVSKISALLFVPICWLVLFCFSTTRLSSSKKRPIVNTIVYFSAAFMVVWAIFKFSTGTLGEIRIKEYGFEGFPAWVHQCVVPCPELVSGIVWAKSKLDVGHGDYFFGPSEGGGSIFFFPTLLAIKSPLVMLVFGLVGCVTCLGRVVRLKSSWKAWPMLPIATSISLICAVLPSSVNIGVRHLLPVFPFLPFLCIMAGDGTLRLIEFIKNGGRAHFAVGTICMGLAFAWLVIDSMAAHPHYLSHFNETALGRPEQIVLDSDLDWGQGIFELERTCHELHIDRLQVYYFGSAIIKKHRLPKEPSSDDTDYWVAISLTVLFQDERFRQFQVQSPDAVVGGGSIWLFQIQRAP